MLGDRIGKFINDRRGNIGVPAAYFLLVRVGPGWPYGLVSCATLRNQATPGGSAEVAANASATIPGGSHFGKLTTSGAQVMFLGSGVCAFDLHRSTAVTDTMSSIVHVPAGKASLHGKPVVKRRKQDCLRLVRSMLDVYRRAALDMAPCNGSHRQASNAAAPVQ